MLKFEIAPGEDENGPFFAVVATNEQGKYVHAWFPYRSEELAECKLEELVWDKMYGDVCCIKCGSEYDENSYCDCPITGEPSG